MTADKITYRAHVAPKLAPVPITTPHDVPDAAIMWLALALKGRGDWQEALGLELDTLRGVLAAIGQELEVLP